MMRSLVLACLLGGALANSALRGKALPRLPAMGFGAPVMLPVPDDNYVGGETVRDPRLDAGTAMTKRLDKQEDDKLALKDSGREGRLAARMLSKVNLREEAPGGIQYDDKEFKKEWHNEWQHGEYPSYKNTYNSKGTFPGIKAIVAAADSQSDGKISPGLTGPNVGAYLKPIVQETAAYQKTHLLEQHQQTLLTSEGMNGDLNPEDMPQTYAEQHELDNGNQGRNPLHYHGTPLMGYGLPVADYDQKK